MFNSDQRAHMAALAATPVEKLCWCGWYMFGDCARCGEDYPNHTAADKLKDSCPECHAPPRHPGGPPIHRQHCKLQPGKVIETQEFIYIHKTHGDFTFEPFNGPHKWRWRVCKACGVKHLEDKEYRGEHQE